MNRERSEQHIDGDDLEVENIRLKGKHTSVGILPFNNFDNDAGNEDYLPCSQPCKYEYDTQLVFDDEVQSNDDGH